MLERGGEEVLARDKHGNEVDALIQIGLIAF